MDSIVVLKENFVQPLPSPSPYGRCCCSVFSFFWGGGGGRMGQKLHSLGDTSLHVLQFVRFFVLETTAAVV